MNTLRTTILAAGAAVAMLVPAAPASAVSAAHFQGSATIGCYGCGTYGPAGNSASFTITGIVNNTPVVNAAGSASFTVMQPTGATCVVTGTASGTVWVDGVGSTWFHATSVGATATASTGWGTAFVTFWIVSPVGNPCGGSVTASFTGILVG